MGNKKPALRAYLYLVHRRTAANSTVKQIAAAPLSLIIFLFSNQIIPDQHPTETDTTAKNQPMAISNLMAISTIPPLLFPDQEHGAALCRQGSTSL